MCYRAQLLVYNLFFFLNGGKINNFVLMQRTFFFFFAIFSSLGFVIPINSEENHKEYIYIYILSISTPIIQICKIGVVVNFNALFNCYTVDNFVMFLE